MATSPDTGSTIFSRLKGPGGRYIRAGRALFHCARGGAAAENSAPSRDKTPAAVLSPQSVPRCEPAGTTLAYRFNGLAAAVVPLG